MTSAAKICMRPLPAYPAYWTQNAAPYTCYDPPANGVLGSLVQRVVCWIVGLLGFVVYLRMRPALKPETVETATLAVAEV